MIFLILGLLLWSFAHLFKRLSPGVRSVMGDTLGSGGARGLMALLLVLSIVLMVIGHRANDFIPVWSPPSFFGHINNLLMLLAFYVYGASAAKGAKVWLGTKIRHPQLVATSIWAAAHLLANGDLSSIVLFGGLLIWAQVSIFLINAQDGPWVVPARAPVKKEVTLVVISLVLFTVVAAIHIWLGGNPFGAV